MFLTAFAAYYLRTKVLQEAMTVPAYGDDELVLLCLHIYVARLDGV